MNTIAFTRNVVLGAAAFLVSAEACPADMIAQWTFSSGTDADLTADMGGYVLGQAGEGANTTTTFNSDGTVTIGDGRLLYASGINSTDLPGLTSEATVWARLKIPAGSTDAFFLGLINATDPGSGSYDHLSMTARRNAEGILPYGRTDSAAAISPGSNATPTPTEFFEIAIVFEGGRSASGSPSDRDSIIRLYIDGEEKRIGVARGQAMQAFQSLGLGRLRGGSGRAGGDMVFDEVRVYDTALTPEEISSIPEPATGALLGAAGLLVARSRGR